MQHGGREKVARVTAVEGRLLRNLSSCITMALTLNCTIPITGLFGAPLRAMQWGMGQAEGPGGLRGVAGIGVRALVPSAMNMLSTQYSAGYGIEPLSSDLQPDHGAPALPVRILAGRVSTFLQREVLVFWGGFQKR